MLTLGNQTDEEKLAMYMAMPKEELAKMLLQANKMIPRNQVSYIDPNLNYGYISGSDNYNHTQYSYPPYNHYRRW